MDHLSELTLHDVRCFQGEQRGSLRPITLLVGENSTGKSTFLGCYSVLHRMFAAGWNFDREPDFNLDFNVEPFFMGSFRDVARSGRGAGGRIDQFKLGLTVSPSDKAEGSPYHLLATFAEQGSQPVVSSLLFEFGKKSFLELRQNDNDGTTLAIPEYEVETELPMLVVLQLMNLETREGGWKRHRLTDHFPLELQPLIDCLNQLFAHQDPFHIRLPRLPDLFPIAPLRSKPKRTYDPVREAASPEGDHVPMLMMRLDHAEKSRWQLLHDDLVAFGRASGLFSDIKIKRHGGQMSDPFQLQVKVRSGMPANIMDVGYGVSQSLPIIVDVLSGRRNGSEPHKRGRTFLLQQPEVHLHPRGQAELANLFARSFKKLGNWFLVETHSDYIVDRIRIAVRKQVLKAGDVSILYFEPKGSSVTIHNMTLDKDGNLEGVPDGYRDFFLKETDQLLGFEN